jgi:hypothetical protein
MGFCGRSEGSSSPSVSRSRSRRLEGNTNGESSRRWRAGAGGDRRVGGGWIPGSTLNLGQGPARGGGELEGKEADQTGGWRGGGGEVMVEGRMDFCGGEGRWICGWEQWRRI